MISLDDRAALLGIFGKAARLQEALGLTMDYRTFWRGFSPLARPQALYMSDDIYDAIRAAVRSMPDTMTPRQHRALVDWYRGEAEGRRG
jgi:hypothetical protein